MSLKFVQSSLALAMIFHFNGYFSVAYAALIGQLVLDKLFKFRIGDGLQRTTLLPLFCVWLTVEAPRIYLGLYGNAHEQVPKLAASLLLTVFPQIPTVIYFGFCQEITFPSEPIVSSIMLAMICSEVALCFVTLKQIFHAKSMYFLIECQEDATRMREKHNKKEMEISYWSRRAGMDEDASS